MQSNILKLAYRNVWSRCLILAFFILSMVSVFAQTTGSISGKVIDQSNNSPLIGTNVLLMGTEIGSATDLDGDFVIHNVRPGKYQLRFSYISYQTVIVEDVVVNAGLTTKINITLEPSVLELEGVVVTAEELKSNELSVLNIQKNSNNIVDGISAELISKNNSSDGTDVLKRLTGVTMSDGKYAYIRGVGDRYNSTLLNGSSLPSTDPEKKSFSYDLFPANLIENLMTSKTATPDKPADFSGGLIEINTIEFPSQLIFNFGVTTHYDLQTNFNHFVSYSGGNEDWLGIDDGTRAMPSLVSSAKVGRGNYTQDELQQIGLAFKNNWSTSNLKAPMKGKFKLNIGNSHGFGQNIFGYIASLNYSNEDKKTDLEQNYFTFDGPKYEYKGVNYANSILWSGMLNMSLKLGQSHKISLKNLYNRNADNETTLYEGTYYYNPDYRKVTALRFISRSLFSSQLIGQHHFNFLKGLGLNWNMNYAESERDEPDARRYVYAKDLYEEDAVYRFLLDQSVSTRFFGNLDDNDRGLRSDVSLKVFDNPSLPDLKMGILLDKKNRKFDARTFGFKNLSGGSIMAEDQILTESVDQIFAPENIGNKFIEVVEITKPSDSYKSDQLVQAAYVMTDFDLFSRLKFITGVRFEKSRQTLHSFTTTNAPVDVGPTYNDWLPSVNATYMMTDKINLRGAFSRTLARPEFREMAPFSYFDFLTNELVEGNIDLKRSLISNYDLRFEWYPYYGDLFAISGFYKQFDDPIEQVLIAASGFEPIRSYENADQATTYGVEMELRKKLDFVTPMLNNFSFVGNVSLIHSEIKMKDESGFQVAKRPLQGQADYISNIGLYYEDFESRFSASLVYNKVGEKIYRVGFANLGDIIELPSDQIDLTCSAKLFPNIVMKFAAKDLLNQDQKFVQRTLDGDKPCEVRKTGRIFSLGFTYQL